MKADFLQGKLIERDIFFELPEEFKVPNVIQTLKTCVYGLNNAS